MKTKLFSMVFAILIFCASVTNVFAAQGTEGNELQVVEPQQLEIQLGIEWAGVEFMLRTDAGVYPTIIAVDKTGVLSLEIGGSKEYILSCLHSSVAIPDAMLLQAPVTSENEPQTTVMAEIEGIEKVIPVSHIVMFVVGSIVAVGILIAIYVSNKNKRVVQDDEDDDEF
ncbi:MAG: hypothetical protein IJ949_03280 [Oscillospiraceae bacterium]|nr:hypothetical protein [Oscillospiraceae bacterium]